MNDEIKVSICCITYNHEKFIRQCLDGFVMQKTDFKFEVLIHDDASTDNTAKIIKEYEEKYPDIIKPIYQTENQFSKGIPVLKTYIYPRIKGKYAAYCEGDDYWTDSYKLQKQYDYMEKHPELTGCFHPVKIIWENYPKKSSIYPSAKKMFLRKKISLKDLLKSNYIQTNSVFYKWQKSFTEESPENILPVDLYIHLYHTQFGNFGYIKDVMSVYRKHDGGIWNEEADVARELKYGKQIINFYYNVYKNITNCSEKYFNKKFLPNMKLILDLYYKNGYFEDLKEIQTKYNEFYAQVTSNTESKKYKQYRKKFHILVVLVFILILLNLITLYFIFKGGV